MQVSKWYSKVFSCWFELFQEVWGWVKILSKIENFHDRAVLSEISDFDHFLNIVISDLWLICKYEYCILKCSLVDLKDLWKFEVESKFCQKLKIFMTAVLSEISDFDHFLNNVISDLWVNCKCQNDILKCFLVDLTYFRKFEVESKFCQKLKILMTAVLSKFYFLTTFWTLPFLTCEWIASIKIIF